MRIRQYQNPENRQSPTKKRPKFKEKKANFSTRAPFPFWKEPVQKKKKKKILD